MKKKIDGRLERLWNAIESGTMKLWKKERLFSLFKDASVGRVLHGHVHRHEEYQRRKIRFLNAGATMMTNPKGQHRFHLLQVTPSEIEQVDVKLHPAP